MTNSASDATASLVRQPVEQRRLAGVGVADQRHGRHRLLVPPLAQLRAALAHLIDLALDRLDADADPPPIGLELRFARPARADAAAQPRQRGAGADEPRQQVLELRELDLPLAFARARAPGEDVEDELRPVDDLALELVFELAQLRGRQLVVEDHRRRRRLRRRRRARVDTFPPPMNVAASGLGRSCSMRRTTVGAGGRARPASSSSDCSASTRCDDPWTRPTSAARSACRDGACHVDAYRTISRRYMPSCACKTSEKTSSAPAHPFPGRPAARTRTRRSGHGDAGSTRAGRSSKRPLPRHR